MEKELLKILRESIKSNTMWLELFKKSQDECDKKNNEIISLKQKLFELESKKESS